MAEKQMTAREMAFMKMPATKALKALEPLIDLVRSIDQPDHENCEHLIAKLRETLECVECSDADKVAGALAIIEAHEHNANLLSCRHHYAVG